MFIGILLTFFVSEFYIQILMGNGLYLLFKNNIILKFNFTNLANILFFLFFLLGLIFLEFNKFYFYRPIVWGTFSLFFIFFFMQLDLNLLGKIVKAILIKIGDASYIIYLVHPFVIKMIILSFAFFYKEQNSNLYLATFEMIVTLVIGYIIHLNIEKPLNLFLKNRLIFK
jgi:peptidoglycan/LPS O-acetylase OafA/YrhL